MKNKGFIMVELLMSLFLITTLILINTQLITAISTVELKVDEILNEYS